MNLDQQQAEFAQFLPQKSLIYVRAYVMLAIGGLIALGSIVSPDVSIMSTKSAWLPIAAFILLITGLVEAFDTYISRHTNRFMINLQFATVDTVVGLVIVQNLARNVDKLSFMIAAFLLIKGLFRLVIAFSGAFVNTWSTMIGSGITLTLGLILLLQWPAEPSVGFLSFCLSMEIALRGWALVQFAKYLSNLDELVSDTDN